MPVDYWLINQYNIDGDLMDYKELIKMVEEKRNETYIEYEKSIFNRKQLMDYINKYDSLLLELYTKYHWF